MDLKGVEKVKIQLKNMLADFKKQNISGVIRKSPLATSDKT